MIDDHKKKGWNMGQTMKSNIYITNLKGGEKWNMNSKKYRIILGIMMILSLLVFIYYYSEYSSYRSGIIARSRSILIKLTKETTSAINSVLQEMVNAAGSIADDFTCGTITRDEMAERLKKTLLANHNFFSGTVTYRPYGYDTSKRLNSLFYVKEGDNNLKFIPLDEHEDYTEPTTEWYGPAMKKGSHWSEPYIDVPTQITMVTYSVAFYENILAKQKQKPLGILTIDLTLDEIEKIIKSLDLGTAGFCALVSAKGKYLYHPDRELNTSGKTIGELGWEKNDRNRILLQEKIVGRESGILEHTSLTTGLESWLVYEPVPLTGWSVHNAFLKNDVPFNINKLRKLLVKFSAALLVWLLFLVFFISTLLKGSRYQWWGVSAIASLLFLLSIGWVWHLAISYHSEKKKGDIQIVNQARLDNFMNPSKRSSSQPPGKKTIYIPTGIFLESMKFVDSGNFVATGYIWQKYCRGMHDGISREIVISRAESSKLDEIFSRTDEKQKMKLIRWAFNVKMQAHLKNKKYPLEQETLSIRLMHKELRNDVVLVPDLEAYTFTNPTSCPGLDEDLTLQGWKILKSYFTLRKEKSRTDFGFKQNGDPGNFYSLYFNIDVQKCFLNPFISYLAPLIVVAFLLYAILSLTTSKAELAKKLGVAAAWTLGSCAGLFFVVVFGHIGLRGHLDVEEIFYLEYFYLVMYLTLLWVSVNAILFFKYENIKLIHHQENFVSKLVYWPVLLGILSAITFITFY